MPRYIAAADGALGGDLPLGQGGLAIQAVAQGDDHGLPVREAARHGGTDLFAGLLDVQVLQHSVVHPDHVHEGQVVALGVVIQRVGQRHLPLKLAPGAEIHQYLVFNAPAGIGGQLDILIAFEGTHRLDEPDGANGDQVVLVGGLGVVLLERLIQKEDFSL